MNFLGKYPLRTSRRGIHYNPYTSLNQLRRESRLSTENTQVSGTSLRHSTFVVNAAPSLDWRYQEPPLPRTRNMELGDAGWSVGIRPSINRPDCSRRNKENESNESKIYRGSR